MLDAHANETVLDLGAGPMQYSILVARCDGALVIAADLDFLTGDVELAKRKGVVPIRADGQFLPLADQSIDRILMSSLLHMVPEPLLVLRECRRVLKNEGHVVLSVPNHYQFIPKWMNSIAWPTLQRLFGLPSTHAELIQKLNERFHVGGPQGYYSLDELNTMLHSSGFFVMEHKYSPGRFGSVIWELAVLGYVRCGNVAFHLLMFVYPLARFFDVISKSSVGSEHVLLVAPDQDR